LGEGDIRRFFLAHLLLCREAEAVYILSDFNLRMDPLEERSKRCP